MCYFWAAIFAPGVNIVPPIAYKSLAQPFRLGPHVLTPHSWLCGQKLAGGVARRVWSRANSNTILECTFPRRKCEWCLQWQKTPPVARAVARVVARLVARVFWVVAMSLLGGC